MITIEKDEQEHMRTHGIYICSLCRHCPKQKDKHKHLCSGGKPFRFYFNKGRCPGFQNKDEKTPEEIRLAVRRAEEAQGRMFDDWGGVKI